MPRWRLSSWAIIIWTLLMIAWAVSGAVSVAESCADKTGEARRICEGVGVLAGGIGLTFIGFLWFVGFLILGLIWFARRPQQVIAAGPTWGQSMAPPASAGNVADELAKLAQLRDQGVLTAEEFERRKAMLLAGPTMPAAPPTYWAQPERPKGPPPGWGQQR